MAPRPTMPKYEDLRDSGALLPGSTWGLFGSDDNLGALNLISHAEVSAAAATVSAGKVFPLNWSIRLPDPPLFTRGRVRHKVIADPYGNDDVLDNFYPQTSSQWDALSHVRHPEHGFYNAVGDDDQPGAGGSRLSIHHWADRGIVARFILLDVARFRAGRGESLDPSLGTEIGADELEAVLASTGCEPRQGDIVALRFGWTSWYEGLTRAERETLADNALATPGLAHGEETARWLWDHGFVGAVADVPALEALPVDPSSVERFLHHRLIALLGMAVGEMFDLESLATDCAADSVYEGLLVSAPLHNPGGVGSPANAIALK
jgi:kynurenine formamidase